MVSARLIVSLLLHLCCFRPNVLLPLGPGRLHSRCCSIVSITSGLWQLDGVAAKVVSQCITKDMKSPLGMMEKHHHLEMLSR